MVTGVTFSCSVQNMFGEAEKEAFFSKVNMRLSDTINVT
jgi:hypothetical protein